MTRNQAFAAAATAAVLLGLVLGFTEAGSPGLQRRANADVVRSQNLHAISLDIRRRYAAHSQLPQSLNELSRVNPNLRITDPETGAAYEYHPLDQGRFELCAVFATASGPETIQPYGVRPHGAGRQCLTWPE
ncbi:MAG: hypothetical protein ABSB15_15335 [Bryobacteraceae bacterium]|jgi:hypothetical protein